MRSNSLLVVLFLSGLFARWASGQDQSILPHIADGLFPGGSFRTTIIIVNNTDSESSAVLNLTRDNGAPLAVTIEGFGTGSTFNLALGAGATRILQTTGVGDLATGAATISSGAPVSASAVFTMFDTQGNFRAEAGVGDAHALSRFTLPVDNTGAFDTAVAFYNPSATAATVTLRLLYTDGGAVGTASLNLPPGNHIARFVSEIFGPDTCNNRSDCASDLQGSVAVSASEGIAALVLRQAVVDGTPTYTSLPITPGVSQGEVPLVLLSRIEKGVALTSDVTLNAILPAGLMLTGTVSPIEYAKQAYVSARSTTNGFSGTVDPQTGKYCIILPPGLYTLIVDYRVYSNTSPDSFVIAGVYVTTDAGLVQVSANTVKDISLPGVNLFSVSGTVAGLAAFPTALPGVKAVHLVSTDHRISGVFPLAETSGAWQGMLPSGTYGVSLDVSLDGQTIRSFNIGFLTVDGGTATGNVTVPPLAQLSGALRLPENTAYSSVWVSAVDAGGWASYARPDAAGNYRLTLAKHRSYTVQVNAAGFRDGISGSFAEIYVTDDMSLNVTVPALPPTVTVSGTVTDPGGRPVPYATVSASSVVVPGINFHNTGETDLSGRYSIDVSGGTYDVLIYPRPPDK